MCINRIFILVACLLVISACGGGSSSSKEKLDTVSISSSVSLGGSITPASAELAAGESVQFSLSSEQGYTLDTVSGCNGRLAGMIYTVQAQDSNCSIVASFVKNTYLVDSTVSAGGNIDKPLSELAYGDGLELVLSPHTDHRIANVSGCKGHLSEQLYSISAVIQDCTVDVLFSSLFPEPEPPLTRVRIPLVFHILDAGFTDVSDEEIISQVQATNLHFRQQNIDELDSLLNSDKPFVADMGIQFYLADRDPQGEPHNGIIRLDTDTSAFDLDYKFAQQAFGGSEPWPNDQYINIWVGDFRTRHGKLGLAGKAYIPSLAPDAYIGVSVEESLIGIIDPQEADFAQGKTLTHELAHFLGLIGHTHGTISDENNHAHLSCDANGLSECKNSDLDNNFMNVLVKDEGMKMFSLSQQRVMREWLESGPLSALYQNNLQR
ncbi:M43 family zinc metalloprotease [Agaribacterium sp. ZY112]|uniref:M43 family zinc metalloprotease n=1 Tax=Agaribacterium sp. ZY112 TaxID=3233574 RepID=UPI0035236BEE